VSSNGLLPINRLMPLLGTLLVVIKLLKGFLIFLYSKQEISAILNRA